MVEPGSADDATWPTDDVVPPSPPPPSPVGMPTPPAPRPPSGHPVANAQDVRNWSMGAHASAFVAAFFALAFLGPLVVWMVRREVDPVSAEHAKEALNFNLSVLLYGVISFVLVFVLIGLPMLAAVGILWIVATVRGIIAAGNGQAYRYPVTIRFIS